MSGATITWDVTTPSGTSLVGQGPSVFTALKSSIQSGLDAEHLWPDVGGYAGVHRAGSARVFFDTASMVSSSDTDGRLMLTSDTSRLYSVANSQTSMLLGGRFVPHVHALFNNNGSNLTSQVTQFWSQEGGRATITAGSASTAVTLKNTYLTGGHVHVTQDATASLPSSQTVFYLGQVTGATLNLTCYALSGGAQLDGAGRIVSYWVAGRVAL